MNRSKTTEYLLAKTASRPDQVEPGHGRRLSGLVRLDANEVFGTVEGTLQSLASMMVMDGLRERVETVSP